MSQKPKQKTQAKPAAEETKPQGNEKSTLLNPVDKAKYDKYIGFKFTELSGAKLKNEAIKEMNDLEAELKQCSGVIPIRTVTAAIDNEVVKMAEGVPLPECYAEIINKSKKPEYYLGE